MLERNGLHKDTGRNPRRVVPLRKEYLKKLMSSSNLDTILTTRMSSRLDPEKGANE